MALRFEGGRYGAGGVDVGAGLRHEQRAAVVLQLPDALQNVGQGPVLQPLGRLVRAHFRQSAQKIKLPVQRRPLQAPGRHRNCFGVIAAAIGHARHFLGISNADRTGPERLIADGNGPGRAAYQQKEPDQAVRTKGPRYTPVSKRQDKPDGVAWLIRNHPDLTDGQIGKLIGTTRSTIQAIRERSHWNIANIQPKDPVTLGLTSQRELDAAVAKAAKAKGAEAPRDMTFDEDREALIVELRAEREAAAREAEAALAAEGESAEAEAEAEPNAETLFKS